MGERAFGLIRTFLTQPLPLGWWFLLTAEPDIHLLSKAPESPHRRLSLCSLPVPKQFERASGVCTPSLSRLTAGPGSLRIGIILMFFYSTGSFSGCCCASEFLGRHEISLLAFHSEHIGNHLPGYGQRGAIRISSLPFLLMDHSQFVALPGRQLRGLH